MPCGWFLQTVQNLSSLFYWLHNCCILQQWKRSCSHVAYRSHVSWPRSISQSCFSFLCLHLRKRAAGKSSQITTGTVKKTNGSWHFCTVLITRCGWNRGTERARRQDRRAVISVTGARACRCCFCFLLLLASPFPPFSLKRSQSPPVWLLRVSVSYCMLLYCTLYTAVCYMDWWVCNQEFIC